MTAGTPASNPAACRDGTVLYCDCANADIIPEGLKQRIRERLSHGGPVLAVPDLCRLAATADPVLAEIAAAGQLTIIACYPRAVLWLFHRAGAPLDPDRVRILNMRTLSADEITAALPDAGYDACDNPAAATVESPDWRPWFPVIDYDRCSNCRQCLEFCLFGVYESDPSGRVAVRQPEQCKNNCPACARMCPELAIMFPKIDEASPITGSEAPADSAPGKVCITREQLFGNSTIEKLRARQQRPPLFKQPQP